MKVVMTGGGTGGHIYPALAIADKIMRREPGTQILFIGGKRGMENTLVPKAGYELVTIDVSGLDRKKLTRNFRTVSDFAKGLKASLDVIDDMKPDIVIGTGGYVCGPVVMAARMRGVKTAIHEQNVCPGVTNKILAKMADRVFISFKQSEEHFRCKAEKIILSGNPLRKEFSTIDSESDRKKLDIKERDFVILCFAGSLGAAKINDAMLEVVRNLSGMTDIKVFFATGKQYYEGVREKIEREAIPVGDNIKITEYIDGMMTYISAADVVVSRAGALTISELTACAKPSVLIPSPNVTANHQYHNAKVVMDAGGALVIEEKDLSGEKLYDSIMRLKSNKEALNKMSSCSRKMATTDACDVIYENIKGLL